MISGIFILVMMIAFFAIVYWAYSDKQKAEFEHMSNLPLDDDFDVTDTKGDENGNV
jgi:cbb3-type cytochrome oxidase subunit 3